MAKLKLILILVFGSYATTLVAQNLNSRTCIRYLIPNNVESELLRQMEKDKSSSEKELLFYCYMRLRDDTVVLVLSHCFKNKPTEIYRDVISKSTRCLKVKNTYLPILLETDIKMNSRFIELKGDSILTETKYIPKGFETIYTIENNGYCRIISTGLSQ